MDTRKKVYGWLEDGETKAEIARRLKIPVSTFKYQLERWVREDNFVIPTPKPKTIEPREVQEAVKDDRKIQRLTETEKVTKKKYKAVLAENEVLVREKEALLRLSKSTKSLVKLKRKKGGQKHEGIANVLLSDVHLEERVLPEEVEGLNEHNLAISKLRMQEFFRTTLRFVKIEQRNTQINQLVLWILGDLITGWLHEESIHTTLLSPINASLEAMARIEQGIQFLLDNSELSLTIPCVVGNHGRITRKPNHATENGNSLDYFVYHSLKKIFADNDRVEFIIPESGFAFVDQFGYVIRGTHGHAVKYRGGVQGIGVPASRVLSQWNKTRRADLDVFGHHHVAQDGDRFVANGSILGFTSFGYKGAFSFQPPEQKFFLIHSKWGRRNLSRSIFFNK